MGACSRPAHGTQRRGVPDGFTMHQKQKVFRVVAVVYGLSLAVACGGGLGDSTGSECPQDSTLTYESFGRAFFASNCVACHGGAESPNLSTLESIRANAGDVDKAAAAGPKATNDYMPEGASLSREERLKLGEWLACGAP